MNIIYHQGVDISPAKLDGLFDAVGWGARGDIAWQRVLDKSSLIVAAWDGDLLVGMGRILEDGIMCMVFDLIVHPDYQRQGIGTEIMKKIIIKIKASAFHSVGLFAWDGNPFSKNFYEKFGFTKTEMGMKLSMERII